MGVKGLMLVGEIKTIKELYGLDLIAPGHRACAGCGALIAVRQILMASKRPLIVVSATSCLEVTSTPYPQTMWKTPWVHLLFENAATAASGIEAALKVLSRKYNRQEHYIIAFGGDGGTFDIGIQALSGALERGHRFIYVCYDNEAYMNTGIQRSGATPLGAATTTSPVGTKIVGKTQQKKDLMEIVVAHRIPYAATASPSHWKDLVNKVRKAQSYDGPSFIHVIAPCTRGWYFDTSETIKVARLAVETRYWPLYEVENGRYRITHPVPNPKPLEEFLKVQRRLSHLLLPENAEILESLKAYVNERWERLQKLSACFA